MVTRDGTNRNARSLTHYDHMNADRCRSMHDELTRARTTQTSTSRDCAHAHMCTYVRVRRSKRGRDARWRARSTIDTRTRSIATSQRGARDCARATQTSTCARVRTRSMQITMQITMRSNARSRIARADRAFGLTDLGSVVGGQGGKCFPQGASQVEADAFSWLV